MPPVDLHVVSVHFDFPHLTLVQALSIKRQEGVNFHFTIIDNYPKQSPELTTFYDKLKKDGFVDEVLYLKTGGHGVALNIFFSVRKPREFLSERVLILDSDAFPSEPETFKIVCDEIDERGVTGNYRFPGRTWGKPFDICFFGTERKRISNALRKFERGFCPHKLKFDEVPNFVTHELDWHDTGDDVCWDCMGEQEMPETQAPYDHIRSLTIIDKSEWIMKETRMGRIHRIARTLGAYNFFDRYNIMLPKTRDCWNPDINSRKIAFPVQFDEV